MSAASSTEIVMPRMGLTMEEGTVISWLKGAGDFVQAGEPLLEIETDKATVEIEAPSSGYLNQIVGKPGETFPVGAVIGYLTVNPEAEITPESQPPAAPATQSKGTIPGTITTLPAAALVPDAGKLRASPAARRIAREKGINLSAISGSGPGGRIVAWNVQAAASAEKPLPTAHHKASPIARRMAEESQVALDRVSGTGPGGRIMRKDVEHALASPKISVGPEAASEGNFQPATRIQKLMAERMTASFRDAPHFYLHVDVDARKLLSLHQSLAQKLKEREEIRLTITDVLIKLTAQALKRHPRMLRQWTGDGYFQFDQVNIGLAIDSNEGLVVPVLKNADQIGLVEIARRRTGLIERAQTGSLSLQDLEGGIFTITNLGMFGIDSFDAILNPPQSAILAVGRIKERALVESGTVIAAPMLTLSLSVDHRVLDGATAARFLSDLVELFEFPELSLA